MSKSSPFEVVHERLGANFGDYDGWRLPSDYGDIAAETLALQQAIVAFDLSSFGKISITGAGSEGLLDNLLAGSSPKCVDDRWIWAFVADRAGGANYTIRLGRTGGDFLIFTQPADRQNVLSLTRQTKDQNHDGQIQIADLTEKTAMLGIYGPGAAEAVGNILPFDISGIDKGGIMNISFFMMSVTILRGSWLGTDGIEVLSPASLGGLAAGAIAKYHERENIVPAGMECLKVAMTEISPVV